LDFEGCFNFRDLGGWCTDDGRTVRWRRLYRADAVHLMTAADAERARNELGLRTMLDLRNEIEIDEGGLGLLAESGTHRVHVPITSRSREVVDVVGFNAARAALRTPDEMLTVYLGMLEVSSDLVVGAIEALACDEGMPAVFFCAAGKDRTGVLAAVALGALGVRDQDIVSDYFLSRDAIEPIISRIASTPGSPDIYRDLPPVHFAPYEETMERFIDSVREKYGSFESYLLGKGLPAKTLRRFRSALLDA
jgi:protein tyrosine/serine phosphatase